MRNARLVTADELVRNLDDHIGAVAAGNPVIVLADSGDTPVVALVGVDELKYLGRGVELPFTRSVVKVDYASVLAAAPSGQTPIGVHSDQTPATVTIRGHHLIVARDGYGADQLLCSAIAGAAMSWPAGLPADLVVDIARRGPVANVHVIVTGPTSYYNNALDGVATSFQLYGIPWPFYGI